MYVRSCILYLVTVLVLALATALNLVTSQDNVAAVGLITLACLVTEPALCAAQVMIVTAPAFLHNRRKCAVCLLRNNLIFTIFFNVYTVGHLQNMDTVLSYDKKRFLLMK
jgi:hypothetical protein